MPGLGVLYSMMFVGMRNRPLGPETRSLGEGRGECTGMEKGGCGGIAKGGCGAYACPTYKRCVDPPLFVFERVLFFEFFPFFSDFDWGKRNLCGWVCSCLGGG